MSWRVAASLDQLLAQINERAPNRSKISDGSIGDADHANRNSDHNPWCGPGIVTARDFTHDPDNDADMNEWAEALRESRDPRIKYVIWDEQMFSSYATSTHPAWTWRPYSGPNLHTLHMHVSVNCDWRKDSVRRWAEPEGKDWLDMATEAEVRKIVREEVNRGVRKLAVGSKQKGYDSEKINLKAIEERSKK